MDAENHDGDHLSIIPYDTNREVVLRHNDSIVVFDPQSRQLILTNRHRDIDSRPSPETSCPTCGRRYDENTSSAVEDDYAEEQNPSFINHEYFRLLARSLPNSGQGSRQSSVPPSPRRQLAQPVRSPLGSGIAVPPPNAEFVGSAPAPLDATHGISDSSFAPNYFQKFFVVEKELGRGGRGVVLLVKHILDNVSLGQFAVKRVPVGDNHAWLEKVLVEVQALQVLSHQNLVSYRHVWLEDYKINNFSPSVPCAFILQQYCNGGDLHTYVCAPAQVQSTTQELKERIRRRSKGETEMPRKLNEPRRLHLDEIYSFFLNIAEGLRFLHLNGFIHRDLKPSNCLLHCVGGETRVLVSDFGEVQYENQIRKSTGHTGTISYCAPEVLRPVSPGGPLGNFTFKSDIFSLGMILHFLCFANLPYHAADVLHEEQENLEELREEIMAWSGFDESFRIRTDLPSKLYAFLRKLLAIAPEDRPTSEEVLNQLRMNNIDLPELKRRASSGPEDLTPGKRITKIDSPASTGNSTKSQRPRDMDTRSPTRQMRIRGPRSPSLTNTRRLSSTDPDESILDDDDRREDSSSSTALAMTRSTSNGAHGHPHSHVHNHNLNHHNHNHNHNQPHKPKGLNIPTLRPNPSATTPLSPQSPELQQNPLRTPTPDQKPHTHSQLLLPPPPSRSTPTTLVSTFLHLLTRRIHSPPFYILLFAAKILSTIQPCLNTGINSNLFYLVFGLAVVEFAVQPVAVWIGLVGIGVHVGVLWYARGRGVWCRAGGGWGIDG